MSEFHGKPFWKEVKSSNLADFSAVGLGLIGPYWLADIVLVLVSAILMVVLIVTYFRNFGRLRSKFVVGLMTFSVLLFLENLVAAYFYFDLAQSYGPPVAAPLLIINVLGVLGLSTLVWTTLR